MGLDMYLDGRKFIWTDWEHPERNPTEDGFAVKERVLRLGYWRKHPNLHGYIVQTFAEGKDECQSIELSSDDLDRLIAAVKARELPRTTGFFFGASDGTDSEISNDVAILEKAKAWLNGKEQGVSRSITYQASW